MSYTVNVKQLNAIRAASTKAFDAWVVAAKYVLKNHSGYVAALKANADSLPRSQELRGYTTQILKALNAEAVAATPQNPGPDPNWFVKVGGYLNEANNQLGLLESGKQQVLSDLAAHFQISMPPTEVAKWANNPAGAAAALDEKARANAANPNAQKPDAQDSSLPPVETPPAADETRWGLYAGLAAGGALLLKILKVW